MRTLGSSVHGQDQTELLTGTCGRHIFPFLRLSL